MKTFGTLALAGSYATQAASDPLAQPLVGRLVANTSFLAALARYSDFERFVFFCGEKADRERLGPLLERLGLEPERTRFENLLELPRWISGADPCDSLTILHHNSNLDRFADLVWLRDRYAERPLPVTAQLHTLSYPRNMATYLGLALWPPQPYDAVFSSSRCGRRVVDRCFELVGERLAPTGRSVAPRTWKLPVVPLGVDCESLAAGKGPELRQRLGIAPNAFVVLSLARFTEYDKMDLFPLVSTFAEVVRESEQPARPLVLLLAGARQSTQTPEMLRLWSKLLRIEDRVRFVVDFAEDEKRDLLAAADLFASPIDNPQETFGITVVEALAAGLPVVVSDFDGYKETVPETVGIRVPTEWSADLELLDELGPLLYERPLHLFLGQSVVVDLAALRASLSALYRDDARRERLARAAAQHARSRYDWSVVIPRYVEEWEHLTARAAGSPRPSGASHPLGLPFRDVFGHYPTRLERAGGPLRLTPLGAALTRPKSSHPIYPELANLFDAAAVTAASAAIGAGAPYDNVLEELVAALPRRDRARAEYVLAWLAKHGLSQNGAHTL